MAADVLRREVFAAGSAIFKVGDPPRSAYLIQSGQVDIMIMRDGKEVCVSTLQAGDLVGEMALIDAQPRAATALATQSCNCVVITPSEFQQRLDKSDPLVKAMLKVLTKRLRKSSAAPSHPGPVPAG